MAEKSSGNKEFDIVVFGATGFTGGYVAREMQETCGTDRPWAIAGRTRSKLNCLHQELALPGSVGVIQADVNETESIREMCGRTRLLLTCAGPYGVHGGDLVIRMCIEEGSDYLDLSGEIDYIEAMRERYSKLADEKGVFIIPACGYVSMVSELAVHCSIQAAANLELSSYDGYHMICNSKGVHKGTWHSLLEAMSHWRRIDDILSRLEKSQTSNLKQQWHCPLHHDSRLKKWFIRKPATDSYMIRLTQSDIAKRDGKKQPSFVMTENISIGGFITLFLTILFFILVFLPVQFSFVRNFLVKNYRSGPSHAGVKQTTFQFVADATLSGAEGEKKQVCVNVSGVDPGYVVTSCLCVHGALTLLEEKDNIRSSTGRGGGVLTPGFVFENTNLVKRLNETRKIAFETKEI